MTLEEARLVAIETVYESGLTAGEMWVELRRHMGFRPGLRRRAVTWGEVFDLLVPVVMDVHDTACGVAGRHRAEAALAAARAARPGCPARPRRRAA